MRDQIVHLIFYYQLILSQIISLMFKNLKRENISKGKVRTVIGQMNEDLTTLMQRLERFGSEERGLATVYPSQIVFQLPLRQLY